MKSPDATTVFLVSGGAKGITSLCVRKLADQFKSSFILIGRSPQTPEPDWASGAQDDMALKKKAMLYLQQVGEPVSPKRVQELVKEVTSSREIWSTLHDIENSGGNAIYISVDVTDRDELSNAVKQAESQLGSVTGCIHGAGVLADKLIQQKTAHDIKRVIDVKVHGLMNMLAVVPPEQLAYLVLFSSVAGFYGNVGQADYSAANEILNKIAHQVHYRHPECRVVALDWGPWDGGMVTPALKAVLAERNVAILPVDIGTDILAETLTIDTQVPQLVVGGEMVSPTIPLNEEMQHYSVRRQLTLKDNPFLRDHVIGGHAVLPTVCAVAWAANTCEQLYPGYSFYCVDDYRALKGIVFDDSLADSYILSLGEIEKSNSDGIKLEAMISSETKEGRPRFHYKMQLTLRRELPQAPVYTNFDPVESNSVDGMRLYMDNTLFHGPSFRGVKRVINISSEKLTMTCDLPSISLAEQGQFQIQSFNPFVTDIQLQSLLIWAKSNYGFGGLPLRIAKGVQYRRVPTGQKTYASMEVKTASSRRLVADVIVHDSEGVVYSQVTGAEITLSDRLNTLFRQNQLA